MIRCDIYLLHKTSFSLLPITLGEFKGKHLVLLLRVMLLRVWRLLLLWLRMLQ